MWAQILNFLLGLWVTASPALIGLEGGLKTQTLIIGPWVACFACVAIWDVTRGTRYLNVPLGLWLVLASFYALGTASTIAFVHYVVAGLAIALLSLVRGAPPRARYGGGWRAVRF
jgi:hypothetical protein